VWHYRLRGYRIVGANVWSAGSELDLIVRRGRRLVFCEVKSKSGGSFGAPEEMVDAKKRRRLYRAAAAWLAAHPETARLEVDFEVLADDAGRVRRVPLGDPL
jgi:putative endonuclease